MRLSEENKALRLRVTELQEAAVMLAKKWESSMNPCSHAWSQLVEHQRPLLMELACNPDSVLGVEKQLGKDNATMNNASRFKRNSIGLCFNTQEPSR